VLTSRWSRIKVAKMKWEPMTEEEIWELINQAYVRMTIPQKRFWDVVRINPEKWQQHPYGDLGGGFWVVAVVGRTVVWYNDIEHGFNRSKYTVYGEIGRYWCNQDALEWSIQDIMNEIEHGYPESFGMGPPQPIT
jgi:hypothetical protein